jgi:glyoxylase-like metal-dependent hydrolase (beta-lactamase superfamily II)
MNALRAARQHRLQTTITWVSSCLWLLGSTLNQAAAAVDSTDTTAVAAHGIHMQKLRPNLHLLSGAGANIVVWSGVDGTVLVDTGLPGASTLVYAAVASIAPGRLRFVVNTNSHPDHTGGNDFAVSVGAVVVDHEMVYEKAAGDTAAPLPKHPLGLQPIITSDESLAFELNGDRIDIVHVANAHTRGDMVVRWSDADVVHLGDVYWNGLYPIIDVPAGGSLAGMVAAIEAALSRTTEHTTFVPGHGPASGREELEAYRDMLVAVGRKVREAIEQGRSLDEILALHPSAEFDGRFAQNSLVAADEFVRTVYRDLTATRSSR